MWTRFKAKKSLVAVERVATQNNKVEKSEISESKLVTDEGATNDKVSKTLIIKLARTDSTETSDKITENCTELPSVLPNSTVTNDVDSTSTNKTGREIIKGRRGRPRKSVCLCAIDTVAGNILNSTSTGVEQSSVGSICKAKRTNKVMKRKRGRPKKDISLFDIDTVVGNAQTFSEQTNSELSVNVHGHSKNEGFQSTPRLLHKAKKKRKNVKKTFTVSKTIVKKAKRFKRMRQTANEVEVVDQLQIPELNYYCIVCNSCTGLSVDHLQCVKQFVPLIELQFLPELSETVQAKPNVMLKCIFCLTAYDTLPEVAKCEFSCITKRLSAEKVDKASQTKVAVSMKVKVKELRMAMKNEMVDMEVQTETEPANNLTERTCSACLKKLTLNDYFIHSFEFCLRKFRCYICTDDKLQFENTSDMCDHMESFHKLKMFNCKLCGFQTFNFYKLREHVRFNHDYEVYDGVQSFDCKYCNKQFHSLAQKDEHEEIVHRTVLNLDFGCAVCGDSFKTNLQLKGHICQKSKKAPTKCRRCLNGTVYNSLQMAEHNVQKHNLLNMCTLCGHFYDDTKKMFVHMFVSHSELFCPFCKDNFGDDLKKLYIHMESIHMICSTCDMVVRLVDKRAHSGKCRKHKANLITNTESDANSNDDSPSVAKIINVFHQVQCHSSRCILNVMRKFCDRNISFKKCPFCQFQVSDVSKIYWHFSICTNCPKELLEFQKACFSFFAANPNNIRNAVLQLHKFLQQCHCKCDPTRVNIIPTCSSGKSEATAAPQIQSAIPGTSRASSLSILSPPLKIARKNIYKGIFTAEELKKIAERMNALKASHKKTPICITLDDDNETNANDNNHTSNSGSESDGGESVFKVPPLPPNKRFLKESD